MTGNVDFTVESWLYFCQVTSSRFLLQVSTRCSVKWGEIEPSVSTPLSILISSLSLDHYLYTHDTHLFLSFYPLNIDSIISHLQNALQCISSWMTLTFCVTNRHEIWQWLIGQLALRAGLAGNFELHSKPVKMLNLKNSRFTTIWKPLNRNISAIHWTIAG